MSEMFRRFALAVAGICAAALMVAIVLVIGKTCENYANAEETGVVTYEEEYYPGQPLDAVRVNAPTFSGGKYAYKVCDRTSGACWWLVKDPDGKWQVYLVCEGYSYVAQQTEATK